MVLPSFTTHRPTPPPPPGQKKTYEIKKKAKNYFSLLIFSSDFE